MVLALKSLHVVVEGARVVRVEFKDQILEEVVVGVFVADGYVWKGGKRISDPSANFVREQTCRGTDVTVDTYNTMKLR